MKEKQKEHNRRINVPSPSAMVLCTPPFCRNSPNETIQREMKKKKAQNPQITNPRSRSSPFAIKPKHQTSTKHATFSQRTTYSTGMNQTRRSKTQSPKRNA